MREPRPWKPSDVVTDDAVQSGKIRPAVQATEKIWMNGEFVDWADARSTSARTGSTTAPGCSRGSAPTRRPRARPFSASASTSSGSHDSAKILYMEIPYSVEELRDVCHELIGINGLPECYMRPIAFYGYSELGVTGARTTPSTS